MEMPGTHPWAEPSKQEGPDSSAICGQLGSIASSHPTAEYEQESNGWADETMFLGYQLQGSDITLSNNDDASPLLSAQPDPLLFEEVMQFGQFNLNDNPNNHQPHFSPSQSPYISPRILPQQDALPQFYADSMNLVPNSFEFHPSNPWGGMNPTEPFNTEPEINIDFAPPRRQASFEPPKYTDDADALSPPDRARSRNRIQAKSDSFSASTARSQSAERIETLRLRRVSDTFREPSPSYSRYGNLETERTQKHPATFQCTLCPKRFTRAYNLRSHLRNHTDDRPFVCIVCGKAFARQHDRKRHQSLHSTVTKSKYAYTYDSGEELSASEHDAGDTRARETQIAILRAGWATPAEEGGWLSDSKFDSQTYETVDKNRQASTQSYYTGENMTSTNVYEEGSVASDDQQDSKAHHLLPQSIAQAGTFIEPSGLPAPVPSDSGYRSGLGTDTESTCSLGSVGSSFGIPADFLQEFIAFFGNMLIKKSGAQQWAEHALTLRSSDEIETQLSTLLKEYAMELTSNLPNPPSNAFERIQQALSFPDGQALAGAALLIRRYRPKIARYFRNNAISVSDSTESLSERLQQLGKELSLEERFGLFAKLTSKTDDTLGTALDMGIDDEDDEAVTTTNIALVQELLVSCHAFDRLALALRRTLYHDDGLQMANVRMWVSEGLQKSACNTNDIIPRSLKSGCTPYHQARFNVNWPIAEFMRSQYGTNFPNIGAVVTLTGSTLYAQATTCAEYVKTIWPSSGPVFLDLLEAGLSRLRKIQGTEGVVSVQMELSPSFSYQCLELTLTSSGNPEITVEGTDKAITELAQQLCWIGSAMNTSPFGEQLAYAKPLLKKHSLQNSCSQFEIAFTHQSLQATETACWLPLFCGATIACGFPIPDRGNEVGLEIPLQLLAGISGACHMVEYEGGVVMKGFSHMLVPIRREQDRVQWHVITSPDPEIRLPYHDALSRCENRASIEELSLGELSQSRAFVGWCSVATSTLGSELANYENIDYSGAVSANSDVRCAGGSLGFQQFGMASLDFKLGAKDGKCHFQRSGPYQRIISAAERTSVVLYDSGEQRAWLVPASGVMLHIAQHRHWLEPFTVNGRNIKLNTSCLPGSSAKERLLQNSSVRLSDADEYTFKDMILNIWSLLEFLVDQNVIRDRNTVGTPIKGTLREYLHGFEFKAVVEERSPLRLKQTLLGKTHGGWPQLVRDIDALVLLADGFEDIILPAEEGHTHLCNSWQRVPKGKDYLATTTRTLKDLYDVAGCRLNRKYLTSTQLLWHQGDSLLFDECEETKPCQCNRLQEIVPKSAIGTITSPGRLADKGAVIFGYSGWPILHGLTSKPRPETPKKSGVYSQPNIPLQPIVIQQQSDMSDGDNLGESDLTTNSTPGSLSSCTTASTQDVEPNMSPCSRNQHSLPETFLGLSNEDMELEESMDRKWKRNDNFEVQDSV